MAPPAVAAVNGATSLNGEWQGGEFQSGEMGLSGEWQSEDLQSLAASVRAGAAVGPF